MDELAKNTDSRTADGQIPGLLDNTTLKLIAMVCMLIDHIGDQFFPGVMWLRAIGRIAMPIFSFCIAEGYIHTHDRWRYLSRMGIFALVSEVPFDLYFFGHVGFEHQNIMLTFFLAILALIAFDTIRERIGGIKGTIMGLMPVLMLCLASLLLATDYHFIGVGLVFVYYVFASRGRLVRTTAGAAYFGLLENVGIHTWGLLATPFILLYNGERGRGLKMLFYLFYPGHLLVLQLIKILV